MTGKSVDFDHGVFVSACCEGERCFCGKPAAAKVEEVVIFRSPPSARQLPLCRALQANHDAPRLQMGGAEVMNVQTDLLNLERYCDRGNPRVYVRRNDKRIRIKETRAPSSSPKNISLPSTGSAIVTARRLRPWDLQRLARLAGLALLRVQERSVVWVERNQRYELDFN